MADRSILVRLRADIGDLRSKMTAASTAIKGVATTAQQVSAKSVDSLGKIGPGLSKGLDGVDKHKQSLHTLGTGFTVLGVAAAAGVGVAVKSFADFDEAMSHVSATGKDAQTNLGFLRQAALQAGADTKYSATEAAEGVESLLKAGVSAQDVLNGGLTGALNLAASGNLDVADSAEVAASAMTQFGLKGADVPHVADLLAAAAGKAQGEVSDMGAALNQSGLVASGFGLSIEETVGTLAAFASAGLTGSDAGTSFKTMIQRLQNPTDEASATMKQLGINTYDAQGKFVGMAAFAEQLRTKLSGLTDEQRNAALATIFGADAIRGANVLYKDGGQGIADWIGQVNAAGYAAETAGKRMDNLKGDFEQLKGSIDTGLIQAGSGANDFLRDLTQQATKAANAFGHLSPQAQQSALTTAAIAGGAALGIAGLIKLATTAAAAKTALSDLNLLSGRTGAALGVVGKAAAVAATAFVVAEAAGAGFDAIFRKGDPSYTEAGTALVALGKSADSAGSGMDQFFSMTSGATNDIDPFISQIHGLDDALQRVLNPTDKQHVSDVLSGWLPGSDQLEVLQKRFSDLDGQMVQLGSTGHLDQVTAGFAAITEQAKAQGIGVDQLLTLFPRYKATLNESANALGVTTLSAQDYADWMGGKIPAAISKAAAANPKAAAGLSGVSTGLDDTSTSAADAVQALYAYADAMDSVSSSAGGAEEAIDAANKLMDAKGFKPTHDQNTAQGRANQSALNDVGSKSRQSLGDLTVAGASQQALDAQAEHYRKAYQKIAEGIGYSSKAARAFADDLIRTPKSVDVRIVTAGAKVSADQAAVLNHELQSIPKEKRAEIVTIAETKGAKAAQNAIERIKDKTVIARANGETGGAKAVKKVMDALHDRLVLAKARGDASGARAVQAAIDALHNKTVYATVVKKTITTREERKSVVPWTGGRIRNGHLERRSEGGSVWGEGTATSDSIPAMLSNGEVVIKTSSAQAFGYDRLLHINATGEDRGYAAGGLVQKFASGGSVDSSIINLVGLQRAVDESRNLSELTKALKAQEKATKKLSDTQTTAVEAIQQLATSLKDPYRSKSTDVDDVLAQLQQGASDLTAFGSDLKKLKDSGLSQGVIDQITADGAVNGDEVAKQILAGGKGMVDALNTANANLEQAANSVGETSEGVNPPKKKPKKKKKAYGGPIWGGTGNRADDVDVAASGGEFMVQEPIARSNMAFLNAFNAGHRVLPAYARATLSAAQQAVHHTINEGDVNLTGVIGDPDVWLRTANNRKRDRRAMSGFGVR